MWLSPKHVPSEQAQGGAMAHSLDGMLVRIRSRRSPSQRHSALTQASGTAALAGAAKSATPSAGSRNYAPSDRMPALAMGHSVARRQVLSNRQRRHLSAVLESGTTRCLTTSVLLCAAGKSMKTIYFCCLPRSALEAPSTERNRA